MPKFLVLALVVQTDSQEPRALALDYDSAAVDFRPASDLVEDGGYEANFVETVLRKQLQPGEALQQLIQRFPSQLALTQVDVGADVQLTDKFELLVNGQSEGHLLNIKQRKLFLEGRSAGQALGEVLRSLSIGGLALLHDGCGRIFRLYDGRTVQEAGKTNKGEKPEGTAGPAPESGKVPPRQGSPGGPTKPATGRASVAPDRAAPHPAITQPAPSEASRPSLEDIFVALLQRAVTPLQQQVESLAQQQARMASTLSELATEKLAAAQAVTENTALKAELEHAHMRVRQLESEKQAALVRAKHTLKDQLREGALQLRGYEESTKADLAGTRLLTALRRSHAEKGEDWEELVRNQVSQIDAMHEDILLIRRLLIETELMSPRQGGGSGE